MPTLNTQLTRDRKENDLDTVQQKIEASNQGVIRSKEDFQKRLNEYQEWKKENNIEGIKY